MKFEKKDNFYQHMKTHHPNQCSKEKEKTTTIIFNTDQQNNERDTALEQAIRSLGVPSDMMISFIEEEPTLELLDSETFSTVNLRDLE